MITKITTDGNVGIAAELKTSQNGTTYVAVSIGHAESKKINGGYTNIGTTWFNVTIFGAKKDIADLLCAGAKRVLIVKDASLTIEKYKKRDGTDGLSHNLTCNVDQIEIRQGLTKDAEVLFPNGSNDTTTTTTTAGYNPPKGAFVELKSQPKPIVEPNDMPF